MNLCCVRFDVHMLLFDNLFSRRSLEGKKRLSSFYSTFNFSNFDFFMLLQINLIKNSSEKDTRRLRCRCSAYK